MDKLLHKQPEFQIYLVEKSAWKHFLYVEVLGSTTYSITLSELNVNDLFILLSSILGTSLVRKAPELVSTIQTLCQNKELPTYDVAEALHYRHYLY
ncbi:hypothetical protein [Risungbinella massiliensis]|uniref:hypothetical protein n=1 Tax=Risungbinella massiliensis TaxID=1329796 RepID=UPI0005CC77F9|nr:hypothetical protein [Risungbinella massiliensis]